MATIEEILAGTDTRGFGETNQTFDASNIFSSGFGRGANQNYSGILQTDQAQNTLSSSPIFASPRAMGAEDAGIPERRGILDFLKAGGAKVRDTLLQGAGATGGLNIGARLGMMINPALALPFALGGAFLGATGIREATPGERGIQQLYGGPNTIQQGATFIDPETGEEVESEMAGYNISSMFGQGIPAAIQKRMDRITKTINKPGYRGNLAQRLQRLEREKAAAEAAELAAQEEATRALAEANRQTAGTSDATGGYQSSFSQDSDFMGGSGTAAEMGSFKQGGIVGLL